MKKQKLICKALIAFFVVMSFLTLIMSVVTFFITPKHTEIFLVGFCLSAIFYAFLDLWMDAIKEKENPLSLAHKLDALNFIYQNRSGTKKEFIERYSEELYKYFLSKGYILQFRYFKSDLWEISLQGKKKQKDMKI